MKHQYFGDVNDYRKYGLLRALVASTGLQLGVCWLLTEPDGRSDGEFRKYLEEPKRWRHFDPDLYDRLRQLLLSGVERNTRRAEAWGLLPNARYFDEILRDDATSRRLYFTAAFSVLAACPLLFFDPDNGLEVPSTRFGLKRSCKYLYWGEVEDAYARGHSLVIYQHYPMHVKREPFTESLAAQCAARLGARLGAPLVDTFATPYVVFVLIARPEHARLFEGVHSTIVSAWPGQIRPLAHVTSENGQS